jgi:hypothetical protein
VAARARVNPQMLRYYERRGLLPEPERSSAGYRAYGPGTVRIVRFIKRAQDLGSHVAGSPYRFALVTTDEGTMLGRLRASALDSADDALPVSEAMEPGPSTLRPHEPAATIRARLEDKGLTYAIVTDPDGRLLGTVHPADLA